MLNLMVLAISFHNALFAKVKSKALCTFYISKGAQHHKIFGKTKKEVRENNLHIQTPYQNFIIMSKMSKTIKKQQILVAMTSEIKQRT